MLRMSNHGILLINLGTPDSPSVADVRRYLSEFLSDPYVIDIPAPLRWLLLNCIILRTRPKKSAAAYQQIWHEDGSPLLINTRNFCNSLKEAVVGKFEVVFAMRYGKPTIESSLKELQERGCDKVTVLPLYPQYALSTTTSSIEKTLEVLDQIHYHPDIQFINSFYDDTGFISAYAHHIRLFLGNQKPDMLLMSFHGLPERHIKKVNCQYTKNCNTPLPCPAINEKNELCYRAQCYATAHAISHQLALDKKQYAVSFQSRLGRTPWIQPYTDEVLTQLREQGCENLAVACPSFVSDCLETLEEIGIRLREQWLAHGGKSFTLIPCLNDNNEWVEALANML